MRWSRTDRTPILLCAIEMDMEALIVTNKLALCTDHPELNNRGGLELIRHLFIDINLKNLKSRLRQLVIWQERETRLYFIVCKLRARATPGRTQLVQYKRLEIYGEKSPCWIVWSNQVATYKSDKRLKIKDASKDIVSCNNLKLSWRNSMKLCS